MTRTLKRCSPPDDGYQVSSGSSVSYAFVDAEGEPMDVSSWVKANIWMTAIPAAYIFVAVLPDDPARRSVKGALFLGLAVTLALATVNRVWKLVHDARHRDAPRDWWVAHHAALLRRMFLCGGLTLVLFGGVIVVSLNAGASYLAALLTGPAIGSLAVLAFAGEAVRMRRERSR